MASSSDCWSRVSVVLVTHHSAGVIEPCLHSIAKAARVYVTDNASDDDTRDIVKRVLPDAVLTHNRVGRGFGNGANQGLAQVETEFALLLGPDSTIDDASLARLVAAADRYPEAGLLGPAIIAPDGEVEVSHDLGLFRRMGSGKRTDTRFPPEGDLCAEHLSGAVLLVRMTALREVGPFDPNIFLYYEDDDLCLRMRAAGWTLVLVPSARATHIGGGSSRPTWRHSWEKFWNMGWARLYIEGKYHGRAAARVAALRHLPRYLGKAVGYSLVLNRRKALRDAARTAGTVAYMIGRRAMPRNQGE